MTSNLHLKKNNLINLFVCLFLAVLGLCCCMGFPLVAAIGGYSLVVSNLHLRPGVWLHGDIYFCSGTCVLSGQPHTRVSQTLSPAPPGPLPHKSPSPGAGSGLQPLLPLVLMPSLSLSASECPLSISPFLFPAWRSSWSPWTEPWPSLLPGFPAHTYSVDRLG